MKANEFITEKWSQKYKNSINCSHPKGFSQRAHCAGKKKHNESIEMEMVCEDCGMCQTHGNLNEIRKGQKDANGYTRCWPGKHAEGTKRGKNGGLVRNCVPNESVAEGHADQQRKVFKKNGEPVGEVGIDRESSPGVGQYYMKHYASGNDLAGYDSYEEAVAELKHCMKQGVAEDAELAKEFDLIESIIEDLAASNGVDSEVIWEDLESLDDDELYVFATTSTIMETESTKSQLNTQYIDTLDRLKRNCITVARHGHANGNAWLSHYILPEVALLQKIGANKNVIDFINQESQKARQLDRQTQGLSYSVLAQALIQLADQETQKEFARSKRSTQAVNETEAWQKANNRDKTDGMSRKAVKAYRREHPGSKLQTAVTTKPSKLKKGSKASKRRKSYCSRSKGQMKMHNISCAKTPDKAICKARRRWNC